MERDGFCRSVTSVAVPF